MPRSSSKPETWTFDLEKCYSLRSSFGMYSLGRRLRYFHLLTRHCPCNLNMNIEGNFEATMWRHRWRHHREKYFFWYNLGQSFHMWGQIEAVFNISKFSKWPPFWARDKLFYRKWLRKLNKWSETYFRHICSLAVNFMQLWFFVWKSISDLDSGSVSNFFYEFIYAKLKIVLS